jgi:hypothetical protein
MLLDINFPSLEYTNSELVSASMKIMKLSGTLDEFNIDDDKANALF